MEDREFFRLQQNTLQVFNFFSQLILYSNLKFLLQNHRFSLFCALENDLISSLSHTLSFELFLKVNGFVALPLKIRNNELVCFFLVQLVLSRDAVMLHPHSFVVDALVAVIAERFNTIQTNQNLFVHRLALIANVFAIFLHYNMKKLIKHASFPFSRSRHFHFQKLYEFAPKYNYNDHHKGSATLLGEVFPSTDCFVANNVVIRGDLNKVSIGEAT